MSRRVLVCGDREWTDGQLIRNYLEAERADVVIEGEARGADRLGAQAALGLGLELERYPAKWDQYGRAAGVLRNQEMLDRGEPDLVLAFHHDLDKSRGTKDMVARARKAGVRVKVIG